VDFSVWEEYAADICTEVEAADSSNIFVPTNQTTRRHILEDSNIKYNCQQKCVI